MTTQLKIIATQKPKPAISTDKRNAQCPTAALSVVPVLFYIFKILDNLFKNMITFAEALDIPPIPTPHPTTNNPTTSTSVTLPTTTEQNSTVSPKEQDDKTLSIAAISLSSVAIFLILTLLIICCCIKYCCGDKDKETDGGANNATQPSGEGHNSPPNTLTAAAMPDENRVYPDSDDGDEMVQQAPKQSEQEERAQDNDQ